MEFRHHIVSLGGEGGGRFKTYNKDQELVSQLTPEQFRITQQGGTEQPFQNEHWNNKEPGLYVSGEPLFSSVDKFDSGTGWPSVRKPLEPANVIESLDRSHGTIRTEVRSKHGDSHLGYLFPAGPRELRCASFIVISLRVGDMANFSPKTLSNGLQKKPTISGRPGVMSTRVGDGAAKRYTSFKHGTRTEVIEIIFKPYVKN